MSSLKSFKIEEQVVLESGASLFGVEVAYHTYGELNAEKDNVIWVCHALTANSDVVDWWNGLFGEGKFFDPKNHFIVCANILGSHYGTTGPLANNPINNKPFCAKFPNVSIKDMVSLHKRLASRLGVQDIELLIGGSVGGQQAVEWAIDEPSRIKNLTLLATNAKHSAWGIAFNETQRMAIEADRTFFSENINGGQKGLAAARAIAMLSYRHHNTYVGTQTDEDNQVKDSFRAASYQQYQGKKLANRFNAYSYHVLSKAMDSHNVGRGRESVEKALNTIQANTLCLAFDTDVLFPPSEQEFLAQHIPNAKYECVVTNYGHDGFLIETTAIEKALVSFLPSNEKKKLLIETN